ncbi:hypothetical protein IFO70_08825 [Phormidium tenue FACHB-886]|nr:hypothetical protein [Phormidium tenue FACHB-886]
MGEIVVRCPRHAEAVEGGCQEATVLSQLRDRLTLSVPEMQLVELKGTVITLDQQLPGKPLRFICLSEQTQLAA